MNKGLFTYTTTIEPQATIAEIQEMLVKHGVIGFEYTKGELNFGVMLGEEEPNVAK